MLRRVPALLVTALLLVRPVGVAVAQSRIACVLTGTGGGKSLTGKGADSYPANLQSLLGAGFEVRAYLPLELTADGTMPGLSHAGREQIVSFRPDVVFIECGTDSSGGTSGRGLAPFVDDLSLLPLKPRIVLLLPVPVFSGPAAGSADSLLTQTTIPLIRSVAYSSGCEVLDLHSFLLGYGNLFPDNAASPGAARKIAERLREAVMLEEVSGFDIVSRAGIKCERTSFYGYECCDFTFNGREARVVRPKKTAKGSPWIWRARFWGHEPQTEIALLERGFHVAYCDVAELFGNQEALDIWDSFYGMLVRAGLAEKTVLEGLSRGGVYIYRWAAHAPSHVACVYADAPVLDMKSWPGGKGKGGGNPVEWERFKKDFGLGSEAEALAFRGNPLDMAEEIAHDGFPMLHVCGLSDVVVPIEENTDPFELKVLASGGRITVIRKPGIGHHPHSLPNPQPIVDFILRSTTGTAQR